MAHSWLMLASKMGFEIRIATPKGYEVNEAILNKALKNSKISKAKISIGNNPVEAVTGVDVVTTDTWASMGQENEKKQRELDFQGYKVDTNLMQNAKKDAIFLHCLPAYREQEVSESVLESKQSVIFEEAENRLHIQKGIMVWLDAHRS
jgi:ornithine carbamoyltransferase